ncbi:MAG: TetR/AcrR family transcriptional regulator [Desulfobacter sp.]|nr:TetR/AcrR family transcriptional regulator [Desulfobacter sp.]WDP84904.1 MAG: TetR/AcrR family transcriptional regulator [Desulfobacter sp.]
MGISDRKDRDFKQREADIIKAAFDLFSHKGVESTTIDMIAERAEVGKGTIYKHFKGKNDIFACLVIRQSQDLIHTLHQMDQSAPVLARIKKMIRIFWQSHARDMVTFEVGRKCHQMMVLEDLPFHIQAEYNRLNDEKKAFARALFQQAIDEQIFRDADVDNMIVASMGLYMGMLDLALEEDVLPSEELYEILKSIIFKGFMR